MGRISVLALLATAFVFGCAAWAMAAPFAYITNSKDKTVSVLDTATNAVTTTVPVAMGAGAIGVSPDGARVYLAGGDVVSVLDTATNTVIGTVRVGSNPAGLAVTPDGRRVYVSNYNDGTVSVIDTATNTVATTIPVGQWPFGVAVEPNGSRVYVAVYGRDSLATIDTATNTVTTAVVVGTAPFGIAVTPDGARVYVANYLSNDVSVVSTATNTVIATVSAWANPHGIAVTPDGSRVYVANFGGGGSVLVIATSSNTPIATVSGVGSPWGVAITPDGSRVYAADYWGNAVSVIATATNMVTATIPVGTGPWAFGQFIGPDVRDRFGVFRPSDGTFYLDANHSGTWEGCGTDRCLRIGLTGDIPLVGDWDGTGKEKVGLFRPSDGTYYLDYNGNGVWDGCELDRCAALGLTESPVYPLFGLASLDDTPSDGTLSPDPALIDGNLTVSAGINIGLPGLGGDTRQRNLGLDFLAPQELNSLQVWVDRDLPFDIANAFVWEVYTSTDNLNWTLHQAATPAPFGPFLTRFELTFPKVTTRYIKVVTRPLSGAVIIPPGFANPDLIFITELQAFLNTPAQDIRQSTTRTFQNYTLDVKTRILNTPTLYYDFNAYYLDLSPDGQRRYNISNGLFVNHAFNPILSTSANASIEVGEEQDQSRVALLYYASLVATPLRTLSHNLVFSGNNQTVGDLTNRSNAVALYNTAQLYKGIDATLNLGVALTSEEQIGGGWVDRRRLYVNPGINIAPHPSLVLTVYYLGQQTHTSGAPATPADVTENRVDLGASWTPFRSLFLSANIHIVTGSGQESRIEQNYGLNWAPFPDGQLQFSFFYNDNFFPDRSTVIQPTLRWYLSPRRRSYLDLSYLRNRSESAGQKTDADIVSTSLKVFF